MGDIQRSSEAPKMRKPRGGATFANRMHGEMCKKNMSEFSEFVNEAVNVLRNHGLDVDAASLNTSGELVRADAHGHPGRKDCAYAVYLDDPATVWWMDWRTGEADTWTQNERMTDAARAILRDRVAKLRREREAELARRHADAAQRAQAIYDAATVSDPSEHPYSVRKRLPMPERVRRGPWPQRGWSDAIIIPLYMEDGRMVTVQAIDADGTKDLLAGGAKRGGFCPIGKVRGAERVLVGEGLATVQAACQATGLPGIVAIDAGNLLPVAEVVRRLSPDADIIILADDDIHGGDA